MGWLNGRLDELAWEEREALIAQQREQSRHYVVVLFLFAPLLFLIAGVREILLDNPTAWRQMPVRLALSLVIAALGQSIRRHWVSPGGSAWMAIAGVALINMALALSVQTEPARLSLVHVVAMLVAMQTLPLTIRLRDALGMSLGLILPMVALLAWRHAALAEWWTTLAVIALGIMAGLYMRHARLQIAVDLHELRRALELRVERDVLTGLYNREGWFMHAGTVFQATRNARRPMSLAYLDLDHFKRVNDEHGHAAGDAALRAVAGVMRRHARRQDVIARLGGEEFVLLMPGAPEAAALEMVKALCDAVRAMPGVCPLTVSAGLCQVRTIESLEDAMRRADHALLRAKREGRDRVLRSP